MAKSDNPFRHFNSSPEVIRLVVMMYVKYPLSLSNVEGLLAERGIEISHETVRYWWKRFGPMIGCNIRTHKLTRSLATRSVPKRYVGRDRTGGGRVTKMLSIGLTRDLVYSAFALSLVLALGTVMVVLWGVARARERRWPWGMALPIAASMLAGWLWFYPSFVIGATVGGDVGVAIGHHFSPVVDAAMMVAGIGLGIYLVFTGPLAAIMFVVGLAVTKARPASDTAAPKAQLWLGRKGPWDIAIERPVLAKFAGVPAVALSAMRFHANVWERAKRYRTPRTG